MKKRRYVIFGILVFVINLFIVFFLLWQEPHIRQDKFTFAQGEQIPTNSHTYLQYGFAYKNIEFDASMFSFDEIGEHIVEVTFEGEVYSLCIEILDQEPPIISFSQQDVVTLYRQQGTLLLDPLFQIEDQSETTYTISPNENSIQEGLQTICVKATDTQENVQELCEEVNIRIEDKSVKRILENFIKTKNLSNDTFGFFYYSPMEDEAFMYNSEFIFHAASTIKVPLAMLYVDKMDKGEVLASSTLTLLEADIEAGGGRTIYDYKIHTDIPISYLLEQSIVNSDNTATNMLVRGLGGFTKFRNMLTQFSDIELPASFYVNNEASTEYMFDVMNYLYANSEKYSSVIELMKRAARGEYLQESSDIYEIAQKYGDYDAYMHTMGIVYTPQPYIVGIFTNNNVDPYHVIVDLNTELLQYHIQKED